MRVLLLFPMADGQTGPAIKYAFEQLGYEVLAVDAKIEPWNSYNTGCFFMPDLVFCSRTPALIEEVKKIKGKFKDITICMWNVDTRANINKYSHLFPLVKSCDYHFIVDTRTIPQWRKLNINTFWLPQGLQNEVYDKPKEITDADRARYSCDVSFAGGLKVSSHKHRGQYVEAIRKEGVDLKLWGCRGNPQVYDEEHNKMVSLSKINLCCSAYPGNGAYTSVRNYKVMGAGGFVLELDREGLEEIFPMDIYRYYENPTDLVGTIKYYLKHEKERKEIATRGYEWVHREATYTHRIRRALEIMGMK